jgi:MinD-like ATPase involved in chromosome partitioning or flagellar assembly
MSLFVLASPKGAPGVTTAAVALGAVWPRRALVVECDPAGGDLAARFHLSPEPSLLSLGMVARRGHLTPDDVEAHLQHLPRGLEVLIGLRAAEQAGALGRLWSVLPAALAEVDADVLVDCGRLTMGPPTEDLARHADLVMMVSRPTVEAVAHLAHRLEGLGRLGAASEVVLVGEQPFARGDVEGALGREGITTRVLGVLADDARGAAMLAGQPGRERWLARVSPLVRSARSLAEELVGRFAAATSSARVDG